MKKIWLLLMLALLISGCATTPVLISAAKQAPTDRVLAFQTSGDDKTATLTVIRDEGFIGGGCYCALHINHILAARLAVGEFAMFYVAPGEVLLRNGVDPQGKGLCGVSKDHWTQIETLMKPGERKTFRMGIDASGNPQIQRSDR